MDLSKLRRGELIAAIGGAVLLISLLFLNWYSVNGVPGRIGDLGAWDDQGPLGTLANLVILAAGASAVWLAVVTATSRTTAIPVATSAVTTALGAAAAVMVVLRMIFRPDIQILVFKLEDTTLQFGIFLALAATIAIAYGGWKSMQEEGMPDRRPSEPPRSPE